MRQAWWTAVVAAAMATAAGCQGSVNVGGEDCPASAPAAGDACTAGPPGEAIRAPTCDYADGPCQMSFSCTDHTWGLETAVCVPAAVDCWSASEGDVCAVPGDSCGEDTGCGSGFLNECGDDHRWHMSESFGGGCCDCCGGGECPAIAPAEGSYCDPCYDPPSCDYEGFCGGGTASCGPDGLWHTNYGDCPPPPAESCSVYGSDGECIADPSCRWLEPGCMGPMPAQAGCYPAADCTDTSCDSGLSCQFVDVDPCWNKDCSECSAGAYVCLP